MPLCSWTSRSSPEKVLLSLPSPSCSGTGPGKVDTWFQDHLPLHPPGGCQQTLTSCSRDVRLMKRRKSSPPEDTATEESTPVRQAVAHVRLSLRPRIVSPERAGKKPVKIRSCFREHTRLKLNNTPSSLLRNSSRVRMAATADAMAGSLFICALKYPTSSAHGHSQTPLTVATITVKKKRET